jgi:hypothetical protein
MLKYDPVNEVEDAVKNHDFFKAYSLGVTLLSSYANRILEKFLGEDKMENIGSDMINRMDVSIKMILLYNNSVFVHPSDGTKKWNEKDLVLMAEYIERIVPCIEKLRTIESESIFRTRHT